MSVNFSLFVSDVDLVADKLRVLLEEMLRRLPDLRVAVDERLSSTCAQTVAGFQVPSCGVPMDDCVK
jgi:hypothetical protein